MKSTVTVVDFGTSKVVALIADISSRQHCDVIGVGMTAYEGYNSTSWNVESNVSKAIDDAIKAAEEQSRKTAREVYCGIPGQFSKVHMVEVKRTLQQPDAHVTEQDIKNLFTMADKQIEGLPGTPIHRSPAWFRVDGGKTTLEPLGMRGSELTAMISYVIADQFFVTDVAARLRSMGRNPIGFFSTPISEAMLYIPEEERDRVSALIDVGYLNTEVMVVQGDAMVYHKTIEQGGIALTLALTYGLKIPMTEAEELKRSYRFDTGKATAQEMITVGGDGLKSYEYAKVSEAVKPAADELCEKVAEALKASHVSLGQWSTVYMTGAGLGIDRSGRDYMGDKIGRPVRDLPSKSVTLSSPRYASTLGLLDMIAEAQLEKETNKGGVGGFLRSLFGA